MKLIAPMAALALITAGCEPLRVNPPAEEAPPVPKPSVGVSVETAAGHTFLVWERDRGWAETSRMGLAVVHSPECAKCKAVEK